MKKVFISFEKDEKGNETNIIQEVLEYCAFPKYYKQIEIDENKYQLSDLIAGMSTAEQDKNGEWIFYTPKEELTRRKEESEKISLRNIRPRLLTAFDRWEKAVLRGREADSVEIMNWYQNLLDLNNSAFLQENIPDRIKYYL